MPTTTPGSAVPLGAPFLAALGQQPGQLTVWAPGPSRKSDTVPLQDTPSPCPFSRAPGPHVLLLSLGQFRASPRLLSPAQLLAEPWHLGVIYFCHATSLPVSKPTFPVASGASPPGPGLSSAAPRWCRASCAACTAHGCPCRAAGSSC